MSLKIDERNETKRIPPKGKTNFQLIKTSLINFDLFAEKLVTITLSTDDADGCGGNSNIKIELIQSHTTCTTNNHASGNFSKGTSLEWNDLGDCRYKDWNTNKGQYSFGCRILKKVGPKKQTFWPFL